MVKARARLVLDHDGLAELRPKLRRNDARQQVGRAARRLRHDELIGLSGYFAA